MRGKQIGPYLLGEELGTGGMGTVYRAEAPDGVVAIKILHRHLLAAPTTFKRFMREADLGRRVNHENVVRTRDVDVADLDGDTVHYLVMDYVEGQTLRQLLVELGQVPEELCRHISASIADGLEGHHAAGAIHRDLKPENVLITPDHVVKVMDLGVALLADEAMRLSQTGQFLGSVMYAAPEQWELQSKPDARTDIFSVGVMLYELGTGRHPFRRSDSDGFTPPHLAEVRPAGRVNPQLSAFFEELVACLMARTAEERLPSAVELARVVREAEDSTWWRKRAPALRSATRRPLRRIRIPRETPLFGRDEDIAVLRSAYDSAKAGTGRVILIEGEAGIGKSRLVDEFVARLETEGEDVAFLYGSYPPGGAATASGAFSQAYREHFGVEALDESLAQHLPTTPGLVPAFSALLRGEAPPEGCAPLDKSALQTVFVKATHSLAADRPTVVLIDDLHFAPDEGRALFLALSLSIPAHRVVLIGTTRPKALGKWATDLERPAHVTRLELQRLGARDLTRLLAEAFQSEALARQIGFQIAAKSDGNPFFVFEILQDMRQRGTLTQTDGRWSTTQMLNDISVPSSLVDLIEVRLGSLDDDDRSLLDVAACVGYEFDPALVAKAAGIPLLPALKRFAHIELSQRIIRASGRRYVFDHHQIQEALYERMFVQLREQYHVAIGRALEDMPPTQAFQICEHFLCGGAPRRAAPYLADAIEDLKTGHLFGSAAALAEKVLACDGLLTGADRVDLLQFASSWFERTGNLEKNEELAREAYDLAQELGDAVLIARATRSRAIRLGRRGEYEAALATALQAKQIAHDAGSIQYVVSANTTAANTMIWLGRADEALALFEENLTLGDEQVDPEQRVVDLGNVGRTLALTGQRDRGLETERVALALARRHRVDWAQARLSSNLGATELDSGFTAKALALFEEGMSMCRKIGNRVSEAIVMVNVGWAHIVLGNFGIARDWLERGVDLSTETGTPRVTSYGLINLGKAHDRLGDRVRAVEFMRATLESRRKLGYAAGLPEALITLAQVSDDDEALAMLDEAIEQATELKQRDKLWLAHAIRARLTGTLVLGTLEHAADEVGPDDASLLERLEGCWALYEATQDPSWLARARADLDHLRDHAPTEFGDSMVENVPMYRAILDASG